MNASDPGEAAAMVTRLWAETAVALFTLAYGLVIVRGATEFGIGVGTIVLAVNVVLLASYTWGCHVLRHVVGGRKREISKSPVCDMAYSCVTGLNVRHQLFAWCSLFSVMFADVYVRR